MGTGDRSGLSPREVETVEKAQSLKTIKKAMEVPIINETYDSICRITENVNQKIEDIPKAKQAKETFCENLKQITDAETINKIPCGQAITRTLDGVKKSVMPTLTSTVQSIDDYASDKIDKITENYPALNNSPSEVLHDSREVVQAKIRLFYEFLASFKIVQLLLRITITCLGFVEHQLEKRKKYPSVQKMIKDLRRYLRSLKRGGFALAKEQDEQGLTNAGWVGSTASFFQANFFLHYFGLQLMSEEKLKVIKADSVSWRRFSSKRKQSVDKPPSAESQNATDELEDIGIEALQGDLDDYVSEEDKDYQPGSMCSEDGRLEYSSAEGSLNNDSEAEADSAQEDGTDVADATVAAQKEKGADGEDAYDPAQEDGADEDDSSDPPSESKPEAEAESERLLSQAKGASGDSLPKPDFMEDESAADKGKAPIEDHTKRGSKGKERQPDQL